MHSLTVYSCCQASQQGSSAEHLEKIKKLEVQVVDLTEKLDTIKAKRIEDRSKLKDAEKLKIMCEQVTLKKYKRLTDFHIYNVYMCLHCIL